VVVFIVGGVLDSHYFETLSVSLGKPSDFCNSLTVRFWMCSTTIRDVFRYCATRFLSMPIFIDVLAFIQMHGASFEEILEELPDLPVLTLRQWIKEWVSTQEIVILQFNGGTKPSY
jgi:hypothetical protein